MDGVKHKMKGLMKKANNPFSSSSSSFKGQGRVLGSSSSSSSSTLPSSNSHPLLRPSPPSKPTGKPVPNSAPKPPPPDPNTNPNPSAGFNPFDSFISSSSSAAAAPAFECPVCARPFPSEADVSAHVDACLALADDGAATAAADRGGSDVSGRVAAFVSAGPNEGSLEVLSKLLGNVVREPGNEKFRRIRMGNPKIREAVGEAKGGMELLECVGFRLGEEDGEIWATMEAPSEEQIKMIKEAVSLLKGWRSEGSAPVAAPTPSFSVAERPAEPEKIDVLLPAATPPSAATEIPVELEKINRQVRVFFSVPENVAAKIDLPESFYNLSVEEIKREADLRKKKIAESQLLIPKSYREKQAMAARKKYKRTVIRIQFPDGVVLQGVFLPWEPTTMLYEFVSSSLKDPSLEFELLRPSPPKLHLIPRFPSKPGDRPPTLEAEELVPSALLKFKPMETDSVVFLGLTNELLEASEPLTSTTAVL